MYGSWKITVDGRETSRRDRFHLGAGTSNEAEFRTLLDALTAISDDWMHYPLSADLTLVTDSQLVQRHLNYAKVFLKKACWDERAPSSRHRQRPQYRTKRCGSGLEKTAEAAQRMCGLTDACLDLLLKFKGYTVKWQGRENNVAVFGH